MGHPALADSWLKRGAQSPHRETHRTILLLYHPVRLRSEQPGSSVRDADRCSVDVAAHAVRWTFQTGRLLAAVRLRFPPALARARHLEGHSHQARGWGCSGRLPPRYPNHPVTNQAPGGWGRRGKG